MRRSVWASTVAGMCAWVVQSSLAQVRDHSAEEPTASENNGRPLEEVIVTGLRGSLEQSLNFKKNSLSVIDTISAEDIGKFPDLNLSESLQRIPGVSISRSDLGEGTVIDVRGLGDAFNRVEIDGLASNGGGFNFQSIASELFQTATVAKSPTASMVEGGIGGAVFLETPQPLSSPPGLKVNGLVQGVRGDVRDKTAPRVFGRLSQNWNDTFGVSGAVTYSQTKFATNDISFGSWAPFRNVANATALANTPPQLLNAATPRTLAYYSYIEDRDNWAGTLSAQYRPSSTLSFALNTLYADSRGRRHDDRPDIPLEGDLDTPTNYTMQDGALVSATFPASAAPNNNVQNRIGTSLRPLHDQLFQATLHSDWRPDDAWRISPFVGFVTRETLNELRLYSFAINNSSISYRFAAPNFPEFTSNKTDFSSNPQDFGFNIFIFDKYRVKDRNVSAKLDFERYFGETGITSLQFGTRYSNLISDTLGTSAYLLQGSPLMDGRPSTLGAAYIHRNFHVGGEPASVPSQILAVNTDTVEQVFMGGADPYVADGVARDPNDTALRTFVITQRSLAGYVQANADFGRVKLNFGLRLLRTWLKSEGSQLVDTVVSPKSVEHAYINALPSANVRVDLGRDLVLRTTFSRTMERPGLFDLRPSTTIDSGDRTGTRGNPDLKPYTADQGDVGLEWYYHDGAVLSATTFFKKLDALVTETTTDELTTFPDQLTRQPIQGVIAFTEPTNANSADIAGLEVAYQSPFYFLPGPLKNFGTLLNYTYTYNKTHFDKETGSTSTSIAGVSAHSYNATLYYDNGRFSSRLSYAWRGEYLQTNGVATVGGALRYVQPFGQVDLSANYKLTDSLMLDLDILNLAKRQRLETTRVPGRADLQSHFIEMERRFILGLRLSL